MAPPFAIHAPPFVIYALPRSRTAWLSKFLSYRDVICGHETALQYRTVSDIKVFVHAYTGAVETAVAPAWRLLHTMVPDLVPVVVLRPVDEVVDAMMRLNIAPFVYDEKMLRKNMERVNRDLETIASQPATLAIEYKDLDDPHHIRALWGRVMPYPFDGARWLHYKDLHIEVDVKSVLRYYHGHRAAIDHFRDEAKREMRRLIKSGEIRRSLGA